MANSPLILKSLDFSDVKNELIAYLSTKDEFSDYDFTGSNLNFIIDALAYVTNFNGYLAHAAYNELQIDTVQLRRDIISIAKLINYIPYRTTSATGIVTVSVSDWAKVYIKMPGFNKLVDTLVIPKNTLFSGEENSTWITMEDYVLSDSNNFTANIMIYEGIWHSGVSLGTSDGSDNQQFRLNVPHLADEFIELYINGVLWENKQDITYYTSTSNYYQIFENYLEIYDFRFGDGVIGKIPDLGASVTINYLDSNGSFGNNLGEFKQIGSAYINGNIGGPNEVDNTAFDSDTISKGSGGREKEGLESIRRNAPMFYASQHRCITESDYVVQLRTHPYVEYVNVYGGEEIEPPKYGFIIATIKPPNSDVLTTEQKDTIIDFLDSYHIKGIRFSLKDPLYINISVDVKLDYDKKHYSSVNVTGSAKNVVLSYFQNIMSVGDDYKVSKLSSEINALENVESVRLYQDTYLDIASSVDGVYYYSLGQNIKKGSIDLTFDNTKGFYDDGIGNIKKRSDDSIIGLVVYDKGIISIADYDEVVNTEKLKFEFDIEDIHLFQNIFIKYQAAESIFTGIGV